jgi:hypothetical protein
MIKDYLKFRLPPRRDEKSLADAASNAPIYCSIHQPVAKRTKSVPNESPTTVELTSPAQANIEKVKPRRASARTKKAGVARKGPRQAKSVVAAAAMARPTDEEIRMRAYFISERRRRFGLPGDANSDWIEAKRQLLSESCPR